MLCCALALGLVPDLPAQTAPDQSTPSTRKAAPISPGQLGAIAGQQYSGDGLVVAASPDGAQLRCIFQSLNGRVTAEGLWLTSTTDGARGKPFRVIARALGREQAGALPPIGGVKVAGQVAQFVRPGLTEEYSVSMDGVREDFVIEQRPAGTGPARLELDVTGARADAMGRDVRLVLEDSGRILAYNRLKAQDARGREVDARMEVVSANRLAVVLQDATAEYPVRIDPTFSDANWISLGGSPGMDATVYAAVVDAAGNLYVGGDFLIAGTVAANKVARWNGSQWSALGSGMDLSVNALAIWDGQLYAGGEFTMAGGNPASGIAKWDGSNWSALTSGVSGVTSPAVWTLAAGSVLYVGGDFTTAGGNPAECLAQWDGAKWSAVGSAVQSTVYALAVSGSTLYVAGSDIVLGTNLNDIVSVAAWDGANWSRMGTGSFYGTPLVLAASGVDVYMGGEFTLYDETNSTSIPVNYIAKWDGTQWSALGTGMSDRVLSLAESGSGVLYAGGQFTNAGGNPANYIAQWSGGVWSGVGSGTGGNVNAIVLSGGTLYAGGGFGTAGTNAAICIAQWNGANWSPLGSGMDGAVNALAVSGSTVYAGGSFISAGTNAAHFIAQWNGVQWSGVGSGMNSNVLALAVSGSGVLYAGGNFTSAGGNSASQIAQWNGTNWSALGSGMNGAVDALAVSGSNLYAGGAFTTAGGNPANYVAQWNGSNWSALGSGMNGAVDALAVSGSNLYAGGAFTTAGTNTAANFIAPWNGAKWLALGSGMNSNVLALAVSGGNLYAGGAFTTAGGNPAGGIAQWKGTNWAALGSGVSGANGYVASLAALNGTLYVGGYFTAAGGNPAGDIAQWDGTNWSALGSGMGLRGINFYPYYYPSVNALAVSGGDLFAGGEFSTAGTNVSLAMAEAILGALNVPPVIVTTDGRFGFTNSRSSFGFDVSNSTSQTLVLGSSNLVNWVPLQTNVLGSSPWYFADPAASNFHNRFYRAETP